MPFTLATCLALTLAAGGVAAQTADPFADDDAAAGLRDGGEFLDVAPDAPETPAPLDADRGAGLGREDAELGVSPEDLDDDDAPRPLGEGDAPFAVDEGGDPFGEGVGEADDLSVGGPAEDEGAHGG